MTNENVPTSFECPEALQAWAEEIERDISEITSSILPLQQRLKASQEKLDLVRRLIHLSAPSAVSHPKNTDVALSPPQIPITPGIEDHIEEILLSNGKPLHVRDIRASLIQMGAPLPGRGDEANIILRLRRASDRFVRTERGMYALTAWNMPEYSPAPSKKTVRRQRRATP